MKVRILLPNPNNNKNDDCHHITHDKGCACCNEEILENIQQEDAHISKKPLIKFTLCVILLIIGYIIELFFDNHNISQLIFLISAICIGYNIILNGIKELSHANIKIDLLVTIATFGAFLLGSGEEGALLMILFYLGEYIEDYSLTKSKNSIIKLINLNPDHAIVKHGDHTHEKEISQIKIGDIVVVKPGDKIPVDGIIIKGSTSVNQSSITGESLAVSKNINDEVYASTLNEEGYIEIRVTKDSNNTIFSKIVDLIKNSERNKAKIVLFIDRFAKVYTPIVVFLAICVTVIPSLFFNQSIIEWTYRALTLLVISCPCALVISTPVALVSAITKGTKNGIIIKGGNYLEELSRIKEVLFDKTGTLTEGQLEISNINTIKNNVSSEDIISIICSIEAQSNHPIAHTFHDYAKKNNIQLKNIVDFKSIAGKGLEAKINGKAYYVGKQNNKDYISEDTTIVVECENELLGIITLKDKIRNESKSVISALKSMNIKSSMITGDNNKTAKKVSNELGIDSYHANLLPQDKVKIVDQSVKKYKDILMVGDGVNDSPSLAKANVGIAMGLNGADVSIETADIVLLESNLSKLIMLIKLSKRTISKIKLNMFITITLKGILIILGISGYINLWEAVLFGDVGIMLVVVGNSLLLAR